MSGPSDNVTVIVNNSNGGGGCFGGCGTVLIVLFVLGALGSAMDSCSGDADARTPIERTR